MYLLYDWLYVKYYYLAREMFKKELDNTSSSTAISGESITLLAFNIYKVFLSKFVNPKQKLKKMCLGISFIYIIHNPQNRTVLHKNKIASIFIFWFPVLEHQMVSKCIDANF